MSAIAKLAAHARKTRNEAIDGVLAGNALPPPNPRRRAPARRKTAIIMVANRFRDELHGRDRRSEGVDRYVVLQRGCDNGGRSRSRTDRSSSSISNSDIDIVFARHARSGRARGESDMPGDRNPFVVHSRSAGSRR